MRLRDAEVDDLHRAVVEHDDVARRDVAMHDLERIAVEVAQLVRVMKTRRRVGHDSRGEERIECGPGARAARLDHLRE